MQVAPSSCLAGMHGPASGNRSPQASGRVCRRCWYDENNQPTESALRTPTEAMREDPVETHHTNIGQKKYILYFLSVLSILSVISLLFPLSLLFVSSSSSSSLPPLPLPLSRFSPPSPSCDSSPLLSSPVLSSPFPSPPPYPAHRARCSQCGQGAPREPKPRPASRRATQPAPLTRAT